MRIREVGGWYFESFENDFGKEIKHYFNFETQIYDGVEEVVVSDLEVYPNPSSGNFIIQGVNVLGKVNVEVYDSSGKLIHTKGSTLSYSSDRIEIDLSEYPDGIYHFKMISDGVILTKRALKM